MRVEFTKYQGLGNDFILIDNRHQAQPCLTPEQAVQMCDRNFGIGGDGVIFALPAADKTDYTMRIYNSDGSEPEMCGNGIRCLARFLADLEGKPPQTAIVYRIHTLAGTITPSLQPDGLVQVDMGPPYLSPQEIPTTLGQGTDLVVNQPLEVGGQSWSVTCVSMGNPHCITFVEDLDTLDFQTLGPQFEYHPAFPQRINTEFIQVIRPDYLKMLVWERGAGPTLACGTGACAVLVASVLTGKSQPEATIELPGGPLMIRWQGGQNSVYMTGPAEKVFTGVIDL